MGVPPKMLGAMKPQNVVPGGFRTGRPKKTSLLKSSLESINMHQQIKEAARQFLQRRP